MFDEFGVPGDPDFEYGETLLETFVYCSRAAPGVDEAEVGRIIEHAQHHNAAHGITGVLTYGSGIFFQWIEGPPPDVQSLIARLHGDKRHYDIVPLDQSTERRERLYEGWDMERVNADDIRIVLLEALETTKDETNLATLKRIFSHLDTEPLASLGSR